jgi:hypothetical protein
MKLTKNQQNGLHSVTSGKNNSVLKNESTSVMLKSPEKRIRFKNRIVLNCFYIMETNLALKPQIENENYSRFYKTIGGRSRGYFAKLFGAKV